MGNGANLIVGTRRGLILSIAAIYAACLLAGLSFDRQSQGILISREDLDQHMGTGLTTVMGDVLSAVTVVHEGLVAGEMSAEARAEFQTRLDFLHVRSGHVEARYNRFDTADAASRGILPSDIMRSSGERALAQIDAFIALGDSAIADNFDDLRALAEGLNGIAEDVRRNVRVYEVEVNRFQRVLSEAQARKVIRLNTATWVFLATIALAGTGSLLLLRREVVSRRLRTEAEQRASFLAYYDQTTGLPNRRSFVEQVTQRLDETGAGSVMIVDLDNFKDVNDRFGHAMGDAVLVHVGASLGQVVQHYSGVAARLGGDEFAVYLPQEDEETISTFESSLRKLIESEVSCDGDVVTPEFSAGTATAMQVSASMPLEFDALMRVSDFALYHAKSTGRGRAVIYNADLAAQFFERQELMRSLPKAIKNRELEVFLQPKVELFNETVFAFEALVRWRRDGVLLSPQVFIQVAEESGIVVELDRYVIAEAVRAVSEWNAEHGTEYGVSVNISGLQLVGDGLGEFLRSTLWNNSFDARLLTLEITESIELDDWDRVKTALFDLRRLGCRIAIDDFGTGYSSFAYLRTIAADELKIDRSLIDEVDTSNQACFIIDAVMDLAHSLELTVVVEGVERRAQADVLRSMGCKYVQGFYYGKPLPAQEALAAASHSGKDADDGDERLRRVTLF